VTLDRLGVVKVVNAVRDARRVTTDLGMRYGRTRYDVEAAGIEHAGTIHSPSATLAIRGTESGLFDSAPFPVQGWSVTGRVHFTPKNKKGTVFGGKKYAKVNENELKPAEVAQDESTADPGSIFARTDVEREIIANLPNIGFFEAQNTSGGGDFRGEVLAGGFDSEIPGGGGGPDPPVDPVGDLDFIVGWGGAADLDMFVITPLNEGLAAFPSGGIPGFNGTPATSVPSGGSVNLDDTNGDQTGGAERASWVGSFPGGTYTVGTRVFSIRSGTTNFTIDAFRDGRRVGSRFGGSFNQTGQFAQTTFNIVGSTGGEGETGGLAKQSLVMSFGGRRTLIQGEFNSRAAAHRKNRRR
jgi:hypothetical protein